MTYNIVGLLCTDMQRLRQGRIKDNLYAIGTNKIVGHYFVFEELKTKKFLTYKFHFIIIMIKYSQNLLYLRYVDQNFFVGHRQCNHSA